MARRRKTEVERIIEFLEQEGFQPVTEEHKNEHWYKAAMAPVDCFEEEEQPTLYRKTRD